MLIYDGDCGFCTQSASWLKKLIGTPTDVRVEPWQSLDLAAFGLTEDDVTSAAYWAADDGTLFRGHNGIAMALRAAGRPWSLVGRSMAVPPISWLAGATYSLVAKNRYRLPGSTDACKLPS